MPDKIPPGALGQNQNLVNPIRIEKVEPLGKPRGFYKSIVLDAVGVLAAFFAGYAYFKFLMGSWPLYAAIGASFLFLIVFVLEGLLEDKAWRRLGILIIEVVALLMPFYASNIQMLAASAAVALVFLFVGYLQARGELNHGTTIRFFRSTHGIVAKTVTASLLVAVILYLPTASAGAIFIGESGFNVFFNWAAGLAVHFYPAISFTGSFDDFARSAAKEGLAGNSAFNALPSADQDAAVSAMAGQIKDSLSKSFGVTLSASSSTSDVAYGAIENMLQGLRNRFPAGFDAGWGITLFLILRSIGVIAVWVGQFLTMIVYELLLATGIIRIAEEPQTKEVIEF